MAETMIERVAKAIYEGRNGSGCKPWARLTKAHQNPYVLDAMNALHEMREPSRNIVTAFVDGETDIETATTRWNAAIDAALTQESE